MAYQDVIDTAQTLGLSQPAASKDTVQTLIDAEHLVKRFQELHELQQKLQAMSTYLESHAVTDNMQLQSRLNSLNSLAQTLRRICSAKGTIAERLRSATMRPSVPVAPTYQPDFSLLLRHSASSVGMLRHGLDALQWATALDVKPSCWEDQLKDILEAAKDMRVCMAAMADFNAALTSSTELCAQRSG
jgi:hypothetical protein